MDILDQILAAQKGSREQKVQNFNSMFHEDVAVDTANAKATQVGELEKLKDQHAKELETLQDRHERENERLAGAKEKESEDDTISKKRDADRKSAEKERKTNTESLDLEEALSPKDKKVVDAFYDGKNMNGKTVKSVGDKLETTGMGAQVILKRHGSKFRVFAVIDSRRVQSLLKYIKKTYPKNTIIEEIEEGKLISDVGHIIDVTLKAIKKQLEKEIAKNQEKGLGMLNTIGSFVGYKVTDKKQTDSKLFLKFGESLEEDRNYKKEYENYHSDPEQIRRRAKRNEARRSLKGQKKLTADKDVHHKDNNPMNNDKSNLSIVTQKFNRREPRLRTEKLDKSASIKDWINDFKTSDAPQFKGQSAEQIEKMAVAAFYANKKG